MGGAPLDHKRPAEHTCTMKLGLSIACYRWQLYPRLLRTNPEYSGWGHPTLFFSSVPEAQSVEEGGLEWLIDHCAQLDLSCLHMFSDRLTDPAYSRAVRMKAEQDRIELILAAGFDWVSEGVKADRERERYLRSLHVAESLGIRIVNTTHTEPSRTNHFTKDPPIERQIECMKTNFTYLARAAEDRNLTITLENHADYRCSEILQVLRAVDSPSLRANLDTGNPVNVIEDPVEAARCIAPYVAMVHLKDYRLHNCNMFDGTLRVEHAPIGRGDIDLPEIVRILSSTASEPEGIRVCVETVPHLAVDPGLWVAESVKSARRILADHTLSRTKR